MQRARWVAPHALPGPIHELARAPFGIPTLDLGQRPVQVAQCDDLKLPFGVLTTFSHSETGSRRILVVAPLAGGFPVLLRDLVLGLLRHGSVSVTDWLDARYVPAHEGQFGLEDNIAYIVAMMRQLGPELDVVAVCQGTVAALAATAVISEESPEQAPRSLVLIGGPINPLANPSHMVRLARSHSLQWFRKNMIEAVPPGYPGEGRLVYPASRQIATFSGYFARHLVKQAELFWKFLRDDGEDPIRFPLLRLCLLQMDLSARFFLENIESVFQHQALLTGTLRVGGRPVDLRAIKRTALMTVEGENDDISPPGQTYAAHVACSLIPEQGRRHLLVRECGHFSLFHGVLWRGTVLPQILSFFEQARTGSARPQGRVKQQLNH